jgi:hypothetical protein
MLSNSDFEVGSTTGWTGLGGVVAAGASSAAGNYVSQTTGSSQAVTIDYIPVSPTRDVFQLE